MTNKKRKWRLTNKENKKYALGLVSVGTLAMLISKDATLFLVMLFVGVPLFFSKRNWID